MECLKCRRPSLNIQFNVGKAKGNEVIELQHKKNICIILQPIYYTFFLLQRQPLSLTLYVFNLLKIFYRKLSEKINQHKWLYNYA